MSNAQVIQHKFYTQVSHDVSCTMLSMNNFTHALAFQFLHRDLQCWFFLNVDLRKPQMRAVIVRGIKYEMDQSGHTLQKVQAGGDEGM